MDIFKALSDPTRRQLLDSLRDRDGQTLTDLEAGLGMTRFGVMKHLKVLEDAGLVLTTRAGRFKYHYLNAAPIQEVADRWIAPYAKPLARFALDLKTSLETKQTMADKPDFVLQTYIRTTPKALWDALVNPEMTRQYYYGGRLQTDLRVGSRFSYIGPENELMLDGELIEIVPEKRLVSSFIPPWVENPQTTRVVFEIEPMGDVCKLTVTHYDYEKANAGVDSGWPRVVAGLKTLLETGQSLGIPLM
ncbi:MAG TPA: metalloregulator ArsR/SmtB family transcription factor [Devosia sp.]|nr:metalloregulator ArsR/SmtB family transcription factor [Devosia sp.]